MHAVCDMDPKMCMGQWILCKHFQGTRTMITDFVDHIWDNNISSNSMILRYKV
jgi:hypothetical protein